MQCYKGHERILIYFSTQKHIQMNFFFWKHNKKEQPVIIKEDCYNALPDTHKKAFARASGVTEHTHEVVKDDDDFALSMGVGMATDNIALGYLAGRSLAGAMVGEMLAEGSRDQNVSFGGGSGEGAGATSSFAQDSQPQQDYSPPSDPGPSFDQPSQPDFSPATDSSSYSPDTSGGGGVGLDN